MTTPDLLAELEHLWVAPDVARAGIGDLTIEEREPRDLEVKLGAAVYERLHLRRPAPLPNHARMARDERFEEALAAVIPHRHVRVPTTVLRHDERRGATLVERSGVAVWMPQDAVVADSEGSFLRVRPHHPAVSPGFLSVRGSAPGPAAGPWLRTYVHVREAGVAPSVWGATLRALKAAGVAYHAKVASVRWFYPRSDALTVYLPAGSWPAARAVARVVDGMDGVVADVSAFCRPLVPGVAVAWQPTDARPGRRDLSFGEHRASIVAGAAVRGAREGNDWRLALPGAWREARVDPDAPWRNIDSPSIDRAADTTDRRADVPPSGLLALDRIGDGAPSSTPLLETAADGVR